MNQRDKKLFLLRQISEEIEAISLPELLRKLDAEFKERTVRRWIKEMVEEGIVEKLGQKRSTKYRIVSQRDRKNDTVSAIFSSESLEAIEQISRPRHERMPIAYNEEWFDSYIPNQSGYLNDELKQQLRNAGQRANDHESAGTYAHQIYNRLLIDLTYNSSRLEGNTYSLLDTERLLLHGDSPEGKREEEKIMILNHKEAIRYLVDNAPRIVMSEKEICTLHYLLSEGLIEPEYAGKIRDHGVRIGGSTYIPFEHPKRLQSQLRMILEKALKIEDPFELSLFLLIHISYLQTFTDVNKRTARLCANIPLIQGNFVPLSFNDVELQDYISALIAVYELQNVAPIRDLYMFSYMRTCLMYDETVKTLGYDAIRVRYRRERRKIVGEVIRRQLSHESLKSYIEHETSKTIPRSDREAVLEDIQEDIKLIDQSRIVGLGITPVQLEAWLKIQ